MPYAALNPNCYVLNNPGEAELREWAETRTHSGLIIFSYRSQSFKELSVIKDIEILKIQGAPRLTELTGIEAFQNLREFVMSTPTGSDGSGRTIDVDSFAPLEKVSSLERLILLNVRPRDLDLAPIMRMGKPAGSRHRRSPRVHTGTLREVVGRSPSGYRALPHSLLQNSGCRFLQEVQRISGTALWRTAAREKVVVPKV